MGLKENFEYCVKFINTSKTGTVEIGNQDKLTFYALYKQATLGNVTGKQPSRLNVVARYKYDAWKSVSEKGLSKEDAMEEFISNFKRIAPADAKAKL